MARPAVDVDATVAARHVRLKVAIPQDRITAVVGPNGAGKSTLLQLVAGQLRADEGRVEIAGQLVSSPTTHVPTHRRQVAMLAQRPLLFPHLSVLENVAFGPRARGVGRHEAHQRAQAELDAVGCGQFASRRPRALSGGQQQRVAIARALAIDPTVILLDEPLASLDVSVASALRTLLAERLRGRTTLMVTHDALDLWTLADEVALIEAGQVVASGPIEQMMSRPPSTFLAGLAGTNRLVGTANSAEALALDADGEGEPAASGIEVLGSAEAAGPASTGMRAMALFDPSAVALYREAPEGSPRNVWPVEVVGVEPRGSLVRVRLRLANGQELASDVTPRSVAELALHPGERRWASVKAAQVRIERR